MLKYYIIRVREDGLTFDVVRSRAVMQWIKGGRQMASLRNRLVLHNVCIHDRLTASRASLTHSGNTL